MIRSLNDKIFVHEFNKDGDWIEIDHKKGYFLLKDVKKDMKKLKKVLISRICRPNKPVNTFQNAREHEEIIEEEFAEILGVDLSK